MSEPNQGDILAGKYQVERVLGRGGMGMVVAARHLELGQRVALKFLHSHAAIDDNHVARFLREGRAAAQIQSEHVARVFDVGRLETGEPYLVMEYLHGRDLGQVIASDGALPVTTAVDFVMQAAEAIAQAHSVGVLHRDLKPANLFLTQRADESPMVKVIDFGISKVAASSEAGGGVDMTTTAAMMGSPLYMPPEQMRSARDVDVRCDVWGLGSILYVLLTGGPPFPGRTLMEVHDLIQRGMPAIVRAEVPGTLAAAVARCLAADPEGRFANVADLATAIAPFGSEESKICCQRIVRVLRRSTSASGPRPAISQPPSSSEASRARTGEASGRGGDTPHPGGASVTGVSAWSGASRGRRPAMAAAALAGALTLALGTWVALRARAGGELAPDTGSSSAASAAAEATESAAPIDAVSPASPASNDPVADAGAPSATAPGSASAAPPPATAAAAARPGSRGAPRPSAAPTAGPKPSAPPRDLFNDPR